MGAYVYIESERDAEHSLYTVGFHDPSRGAWVPESDYASADEAAARASFLNGGGGRELVHLLEQVDSQARTIGDQNARIAQSQADAAHWERQFRELLERLLDAIGPSVIGGAR